MKETIVKINKIKVGTLRRQTKLTNVQTDSLRKKEIRIKPTKLEVKNESLKQTMQKYKQL